MEKKLDVLGAGADADAGAAGSRSTSMSSAQDSVSGSEVALDDTTASDSAVVSALGDDVASAGDMTVLLDITVTDAAAAAATDGDSTTALGAATTGGTTAGVDTLGAATTGAAAVTVMTALVDSAVFSVIMPSDEVDSGSGVTAGNFLGDIERRDRRALLLLAPDGPAGERGATGLGSVEGEDSIDIRRAVFLVLAGAAAVSVTSGEGSEGEFFFPLLSVLFCSLTAF